MNSESTQALEIIQPLASPAASPAELLSPAIPPSPSQVQAVDAVFAQEKEQPPDAGLLGFAAAGMLLHDVLQDTLARPTEEEEEKKKKKEEEEPIP